MKKIKKNVNKFYVPKYFNPLTNQVILNPISIKRVIYNNPATIVYWSDGEKTVVKCGAHDVFDAEHGLMAAIIKRITGNTGAMNQMLDEFLPKEK